MQQRVDGLREIDESSFQIHVDHARAMLIETMYNVLFSPFQDHETLDVLDDRDLDLLFQAILEVAFYTAKDRHVVQMASLLDRLQQRGLATTTHYKDMYKEYVRARMLNEARELARRHPSPDLEVLPEVRDAPGLVAGPPTEWVVDPDKRELLRRAVDVHQPAQVVVVSHPLCHFSQYASEAIRADPVLGQVFRAHATWLAPQDGKLDFDVFQRWNRERPDQPATLAFRNEEWPMIDSWSTPTFYVLQNGVVRAKLTGWPEEGRRRELEAALRQVGLL